LTAVLDAFWRAVAYCLHPRVVLWSLAPVLLAGGAVLGLGWLYWESAIDAVLVTLDDWSLVRAAFDWLDSLGAGNLRALVAPLIVVALSLPLVIVLTLLLVALLMTPAIVELVAVRRFAALERREGAGWFSSLGWSLGCTALALLALLLSLPLWLVPPLVLIVPPLIWGWLSYRVFFFDALARHASADERRQLMHAHRWPLLAMGVMAGYLGAAPALLWAFGAASFVLAPLLLVLSVWLYTLVFAFASAWFAHFALAALQRLRAEVVGVSSVVEPAVEAAPVLLPPRASNP
jgi:hypothetical protein